MSPRTDLRMRDSSPLPLLSRDLDQARQAYHSRDIEASKKAHAIRLDTDDPDDMALYFPAPGTHAHQEAHLTHSGDLVKALVFGGLDGVVTIFAVVAGCVGAKVSPIQLITVGIGNLLADAFSMGFGEYVSAQAEEEYIGAERIREEWEIDNCPEGEKSEMMEIYEKKYGISYEDAKTMIDIAFKYPKFFLSHMMVEELGLNINEEDSTRPLGRGIAMFLSFLSFGVIPLLGFSVWLKFLPETNVHSAFLFTCSITLVTLFILGIFKARFTNQNQFKSGLMMMSNGAIASFAAYGSGSVLQNLLNT